MRKRLNEPGEPLDELDIDQNRQIHTHIVDYEDPETGIKTQRPVSIADDKTEERAKMQDSSIKEMNELYQRRNE